MSGKNWDIPFNKPCVSGKELNYIAEAQASNSLAGAGSFSMRCEEWLRANADSHRAFLTHSCTAALEMSALLLDIQEGDEVIMPSYTFVSTANAFVLRGAVPVFVDIREDTLNLDEASIEQAITSKTRAIVPVHYAGVACEMDTILAIADDNNLMVIEDAAQGVMAKYKGRSLGSIGALGAYSFHETKNIIAGEGGALLVNAPGLSKAAEIYRDKGTDRGQFSRGEIDKYSWQSVGSSYLPGELTAAFLWGQLEAAEAITAKRREAWRRYDDMLSELRTEQMLLCPTVPEHCEGNAHMYYVILPEDIDRRAVIKTLAQSGIQALFHYVPLHSSVAGRKFGRCAGELKLTESLSERVLRLPLWAEITSEQQAKVIDVLSKSLRSLRRAANSIAS